MIRINEQGIFSTPSASGRFTLSYFFTVTLHHHNLPVD